MILESFEIENFSCITRLVVDRLPATGVIVLHGPNGTGKTSVVEALRACLMDNKSTSKALARGFSKNSTEKPRVTVVFRAAGTSWKIMKQFGSKESTLHSQTSAGQWKLETADPSEAHERTRQLAGGADSTLGLAQLLWLTQAEFRLPEPKKFDADVQARLREILGVLQTPLDDRFLRDVKQEWSRWFSARNKPGEKPKLKNECSLGKALAALAENQRHLAELETEFRAFESKADRSSDLEFLAGDLRRQIQESQHACNRLQEEYEQSLRRLEAHQLASERVVQAEKLLAVAQAQRQKRLEVQRRVDDAQRTAAASALEVEAKSQQLLLAEQNLRALKQQIQILRDSGRQLQAQRARISARLERIGLAGQLQTARDNLRRAEEATRDLEELKRQARERNAPDPLTLQELAANRTRSARLRAELDAAAISLSLAPDAGAQEARIAADGQPFQQVIRPPDGIPRECSIRRRAEILIPGWGRLNVARGSDAPGVDQIEDELNVLESAFAEALAPFGIACGDPLALDRLRGLAADKKARDPELNRKQEDVDRLGNKGLEGLRQEAIRLENLLSASEAAVAGSATIADIPSPGESLQQFAQRLAEDIAAKDDEVSEAEKGIAKAEHAIDGVPGKKSPAPFREQEAVAREKYFTLGATAEVLSGELARMLTADQMDLEIREAELALARARNEFVLAKLDESEETIRDRLSAAQEGFSALQSQLTTAVKEFHQLEGALRLSEGLHAKRAAAAARVEELKDRTDREKLESEAYDRLYSLFEECRDKQLGAVMGPIHDRVLRWMKLLRVVGYQSIQFNDQFLPEKLISRDGTAELTLDEESTGTIEQLALMVRLALGSTLSTAAEPITAILDDPLTHSDTVRLHQMRAVLRSAAAGEPGSTPPAGPMQIFVFTCHPEWFALDGATVVDLGKSEVLSRSSL